MKNTLTMWNLKANIVEKKFSEVEGSSRNHPRERERAKGYLMNCDVDRSGKSMCRNSR